MKSEKRYEVRIEPMAIYLSGEITILQELCRMREKK